NLLSGVNVTQNGSTATGTAPRWVRSGREYACTMLYHLSLTQTALLSGWTPMPWLGFPRAPDATSIFTWPPRSGNLIRWISLPDSKSTTTNPWNPLSPANTHFVEPSGFVLNDSGRGRSVNLIDRTCSSVF